MTELPNTADNIALVQSFIDETIRRIELGSEIRFTQKANEELEDLAFLYNIDANDIEDAILNLTPENYYRGINPSPKTDFDVCAFGTHIGEENIKVYLKYGLEVEGIQILLFSNHVPEYPMSQPFKKLEL